MEPERRSRGKVLRLMLLERSQEPVPNSERAIPAKGTSIILAVVAVVAILYLARVVLIPLTLALLLAFLLAPLVIRFRHWGFGRVTAALVVVTTAFAILTVASVLIVVQVADLAEALPGYRENVRAKLESIRSSGGGLLSRGYQFAYQVVEEFTPEAPSPPRARPGEPPPVPVEIRRQPFSPFSMVQDALGSTVKVTLAAGLVVVLVIFILIERESLRDRIIRLVGARQINVTTTLLDDAGQRISRFLLAQFVLNAGYGVLAGIGLYFIGVPNPALWALLAIVLRYIPYLGIWIAAILPAAIAFAVEPGWNDVLLVFALYFGLDIFLINFLEPILYGTSTGLSPLVVLVAAVFWTWLWGPLGLLLATPLTVCLVVLGRHVPNLEFLGILLSDAPALNPATRFYQRMLAMDSKEAAEMIKEVGKTSSMETLFDSLLVPALNMAEEDRHRGKIDPSRHALLFQNWRALISDSAATLPAEAETREFQPGGRTIEDPSSHIEAPETLPVVCVPARDQADELGVLMLDVLLQRHGIRTRIFPSGTLAGELVEQIAREPAKIVCVLSVPPFGHLHTRYLCRRLRAEFPDLRIFAAILTGRDVAEIKSRLPSLQANEIASTLTQLLAQIACTIPVQEDATVPSPALPQ